MPSERPRLRRRKPLGAGPLAPEIGSFRLHLAAEGKAPKTVRTYTEAVVRGHEKVALAHFPGSGADSVIGVTGGEG